MPKIEVTDEIIVALESWDDEIGTEDSHQFDSRDELLLDALDRLAATSEYEASELGTALRLFERGHDWLDHIEKRTSEELFRISQLRLGERIAQIDTMVAHVTAHHEVLASGMNILLRPHLRRTRFIRWLKFWNRGSN